MESIPTLETQRLILRSFRLHDAPEVQRLAGDRAVADTTLNIPYPYGEGIAEKWISKHTKEFSEGKSATWAITRKHDSALVGAISLMEIAVGHQAELGYWIGRPYWNQGYCTEAAGAVLRYAFLELGLSASMPPILPATRSQAACRRNWGSGTRAGEDNT